MAALLVAVLAFTAAAGAADAKKKKGKKVDKVGLATYNLYLGSDLGPATQAAQNSRTDMFADEVGFVLKDVTANNFALRAKRIAKDIRKRNVDLVGLQEAALWKLQVPTDGGAASPANPNAQRAFLPLEDYVVSLLDELNAKARNGKQCKKVARKRKANGKKAKPCYRGYRLVVDQQEADLEFMGDFDNDPGPDGQTCDLSSGTCPPPPGSDSWLHGNDDTGVSFSEPPAAFPADANFDGNTADCPDGDPATGAPSPPFPAGFAEGDAPVCMFHGIDGDLSLTMRDAIIARKGAGVKTDVPSGGNYNNILEVPLFGGAQSQKFTRGWTATDANVRGKKFRFVNTHLEAESDGSIREDQAGELIAPGGPAAVPNTVLVGDLNSDPNRAPVNLPNGDGGSNIAINRLFAGGFQMLTPPNLLTGGHGELLSDQSNTLADGFIDHILTNNPAAIRPMGRAQVIDSYANGLWNSDHGGVFVKIKGKKKGKGKK